VPNPPEPAGRTLLVLSVVLLTFGLLSLSPPAYAAPALPSTGGWPLTGAPRVLRPFDPPAEVWGAGHRGVDLAARPGDPVLAAATGQVVFAGSVAGRGVLTIEHGGGLRTTYEPVFARVPVGSWVAVGDVVGVVTTGSHCADRCLHWGLKDGRTYLDPLLLIAEGASSLRLVSGTRRDVVQREAAARAAARAALEAAVGIADVAVGSAGNHGFSHPVPGAVTSGFGRRFHPIRHIWKLHDGTDFGAPCGTPIRAPYDGRVTRAYFQPAYGNRLLIDHGSVDGHQVQTAMNHATGYVVGVGAQVRRGQVVGYVGSTGLSTGCHLHLMVWLDGRLSDPLRWL